MISGFFQNSDTAAAIAVVENLIASVFEADAIPPPPVQPSTFTAVIQGFLANDDLGSALSWFDRVAVADNALPPLEPLAYIALLARASGTKDLKTFDHVFDRYVPTIDPSAECWHRSDLLCSALLCLQPDCPCACRLPPPAARGC